MKKKVLYIALDSEITGANLSMVTLAESVRKFNLETSVVLPRQGDLEKLLKEKKIPYDIIKSYPWIKNREDGFLMNFVKAVVKNIINRKADRKIQDIIVRDGINIVHINGIGYGVGAKAALKSHIKLVWHIRELLEEDFHDELYNKKYSYSLVAKADKIITISECVMEKYKNVIPNGNMVRIYNGVSKEKYKAHKRKLFVGEKIKIMYAGTLSEAKGIMQLVEAVHLLKKEYKDKIQVTAIGKASEEYGRLLQQKVKEYQLESVISIPGFVQDMAAEWKSADIACVCSRCEAFGRVTVEAMMSGCVVIGSNTGGTAEIIEDGKSGFLYQQGNHKDLAEKIQLVIENQDIAGQVALAGQEAAVERFSEDRNTREIYEVYRTIGE